VIAILLIFSFILLSIILAFSSDGGSSSGTPTFWLTYIESLTNIPSQWLLMMGFIGFCIAAIVGMDQVLKKQIFQKKRRLSQ
jgi:hypothetical protein